MCRCRVSLAAGLLVGALLAVGCQSTALTSAKLYLQQDQPERAKQQLLLAAQNTPDDPEVHLLLGRVYAMEGDWRAMAAALDRAAAGGPKLAGEIEQIRRYFWAQQYNAGVAAATAAEPDYARARDHFAAATTIDPREVPAWRNLAFAHYMLGSADSAIVAYERAVEAAPQDTLALGGLAKLLVQQGRYEAARGLLQQLVELSPDDVGAWVNLGIASAQLDDDQAAEAAFRQALSLAPGRPEAHYGLGNVYWQRGRYEDAKRAYEKSIEIDPADVNARYNLALAHVQLGDDAGAQPILEKLSVETPDNCRVWQALSRIYARQDRLRLATAAEAKAKELGCE